MNHTVRQGEHLARIALAHGFANYDSIWNHPLNAELKVKRKNPNTLFPGDNLFLPEAEQKTVNKSTDQEHLFVKHATALKLRLKLSAALDEVFAETLCQLNIGAQTTNLKTDANGELTKYIEAATEKAILLVNRELRRQTKVITLTFEIPLLIGHLDPVEELSGQRARLLNLGYYRDTSPDEIEAEFVSAVEEFQCDQGLAVDGVCGAKTQAKLREIHGC